MSSTQVILRSKLRTCLLAAVAGFASLLSPSLLHADLVVVTGGNGGDGNDGTAGSVDGQIGEDGDPATANASDSTFGFTYATANGGLGGKGGNGFGNQAPGVAGNGGNGGKGGNANANVTGDAVNSKTEAFGGNGGNGGSPGVDSGGIVSTVGGAGGNGGNAIANIQHNGLPVPASAIALSTAGNGGSGNKSDAGNGGFASSLVQDNGLGLGMDVQSTARGGNGGSAMNGGRVGAGGNAVSDLSVSGGSFGRSSAFGGNGGSGVGDMSQSIISNQGGNATAGGRVVASGAAAAFLDLEARAGRGGDGAGSNDGGMGGVASFLDSNMTSGYQVRLQSNLFAGSGGSALGTGNGADGRSLDFVRDLSSFATHIDGVQEGTFYMRFGAGLGGDSSSQNATPGRAGTSNVNINYEADYSTNLAIEAISIAGSSGTAYGGGTAHEGGLAVAVVTSNNTSTTGGNQTTARAAGGSGGAADGGGIGGQGGNANASVIVSASGDRSYGIAIAYGGSGGGQQYLNGTAGVGGNAISSGYITGGAQASLGLESVGGDGGSSATGNGGQGGNASFGPAEIFSDGSLVNLVMTATAGNGGVGGGTGNGGQVGSANLSSYVIHSTTNDFSATDVALRANLNGGNGGGALGTGNGADGGSVELNNAIDNSDVKVANSLTVLQYATGGKGGFVSDVTATAGAGGDANSSIALTGSYETRMAVIANATGGRGGDSLFGSVNGGDATANASATNTGNGEAVVTSQAFGGLAVGSIGVAPEGKALATASAIAANAKARSFSEAYSTLEAHATSNSAAANNNAETYASARGQAIVYAEANSVGKTAHAYAETYGKEGGAEGYAKATSQTKSVTGIIVTTVAQSDTGGMSSVATMTTREAASYTRAAESMDAYSLGYVDLTDAQAIGMLTGQNDILQVIGINQSSTELGEMILAVGEFGAAPFLPEELVYSQSVLTTVKFNGEGFLGHELHLGLFDGEMNGFTDATDFWSVTIESKGSGFQQTWDSTQGIAFADLFNDNAISLGIYNDLNWDDLVVSASWDANGSTDTFSGKFVVSAVPEPSAIAVIGLISSAGIGRAIRKRKKQSLA